MPKATVDENDFFFGPETRDPECRADLYDAIGICIPKSGVIGGE